MATAWWASANPESGNGVSRVDWLPPEARGISYYRSYGFTAYEFRISEDGFRDWAAKAAYEPRSDYVTYVPVTDVSKLADDEASGIERYNRYDSDGEDLSQGVDDREDRRSTLVRIGNGLRGELRRESGGGYSIGYDRDSGTAYWQSNPR